MIGTRGHLLLGYMLAVTSVIALAPFRFSWPDAVLISWIMKLLDHEALRHRGQRPSFLPLGFLYRLSRPPAAFTRWRHTAVSTVPRKMPNTGTSHTPST